MPRPLTRMFALSLPLLLAVAVFLPAGTSEAAPVDSKVGDTRATYKKAGTPLYKAMDRDGETVADLPRGVRLKITGVELPWLAVTGQLEQQAISGFVLAFHTVEPSALNEGERASFRDPRSHSRRISAEETSAAGRQFDSATEGRYLASRPQLRRAYAQVNLIEDRSASLDPGDSVEFILEGRLGRRGRDWSRPGRIPLAQARQAPSARGNSAKNMANLFSGVDKVVNSGVGRAVMGKLGLGGKARRAVGVAAKGLKFVSKQVADQAKRLATAFDDEQEYYLGRAVAANAIAQYGLDPNEDRQAYIRFLGDCLVRLSPRVKSTFGGFHFAVLNSDEVNAIAGPGGFVLITRGAMRATRSEAELAGILAHEIGHIIEHHGEKMIRNDKSYQGELDGFVKGVAGIKGFNTQWDTAVTGLFDKSVNRLQRVGTTNSYSVQFEYEADQRGTQVIWDAWYDHTAIKNFLDYLAQQPGGNKWSPTHAPASVRAQRLASTVIPRFKPAKPGPEVVATRNERHARWTKN